MTNEEVIRKMHCGECPSRQRNCIYALCTFFYAAMKIDLLKP